MDVSNVWEPERPTPAPAPPVIESVRAGVGAYVNLMKPHVTTLLLAVTALTMVMAERGMPSPWLMLATLAGGLAAAGSANALNCFIDRDIDSLMSRTVRRSVPAGRVSPKNALVFGIVLAVFSFVEMSLFVNLLAASLALAGILFYVIVYTGMLKRTTTQNIVIGGAAGAMPPMVGWAAVTHSLALAPFLMFCVIFFWTPPHFWALALILRRDYERAGIPMLPVVAGGARDTQTNLAVHLVADRRDPASLFQPCHGLSLSGRRAADGRCHALFRLPSLPERFAALGASVVLVFQFLSRDPVRGHGGRSRPGLTVPV
jgi:protoheme IX farnesyltransferase